MKLCTFVAVAISISARISPGLFPNLGLKVSGCSANGCGSYLCASDTAKGLPGIAVLAVHRNLFGMKPNSFPDLPEDCTCGGEGLAPVSSVPRVGAMPELITYQCAACGHVETIEAQPKERQQPDR